MSATIDTVAQRLIDLLDRDRAQISIDSNTLKIVQNGKTFEVPIQSSSIVHSSISRF